MSAPWNKAPDAPDASCFQSIPKLWKAAECDSFELCFDYCKGCEVQESCGDTLIAGYCGDSTDGPRRAAENQRSGPQVPFIAFWCDRDKEILGSQHCAALTCTMVEMA